MSSLLRVCGLLHRHRSKRVKRRKNSQDMTEECLHQTLVVLMWRWRPHVIMPNIEKQGKRRGHRRTSSHSGYFSFLKHFVWVQKTRGWKVVSTPREQSITVVRQNVKPSAQLKYPGCVNRWHADEKFGKTHAGAQQHDRGMQKWEAQTWQVVQTSRGGHNTTKSTNHTEYSLASQFKPMSTDHRCTHQGGSCHGRRHMQKKTFGSRHIGS